MRTTLFIALILTQCLIVCRQTAGQSRPTMRYQQESLEKLLKDIELFSNNREVTDTASEPIFTFAAPITRSTSLEDLLKIKKSVARHLHIDLLFLNLQFDSTGLLAVSVQPQKGSTRYQTVQMDDLTKAADFGIFEVFFQDRRYWYVGFKSKWSIKVETLLAAR